MSSVITSSSPYSSGMFVRKRVLTFSHEFNINLPANDLSVDLELGKNSYLLIERIAVRFLYSTEITTGTYGVNPNNYSGQFIFQINNDNFETLNKFYVPVTNGFELIEKNLLFDEDGMRSLSFFAENSSLLFLKDGLASTSATIDKAAFYFCIEAIDYLKDYFKIVGNNIVAK